MYFWFDDTLVERVEPLLFLNETILVVNLLTSLKIGPSM